MSLICGRSITRILPLEPPSCDQSVISPRKIRANCLLVKFPLKGLSSSTTIAIFSRRTRSCSKPCAFSSGVKPRLIAARSILPSCKAFSASSVPLAATSTLVPENCFSKFSFRLWLIPVMLLEPSILTVLPLSTVWGRGKEGSSAADLACTQSGTKRVTVGEANASSNARLTIELSFFSFCHICPLSR